MANSSMLVLPMKTASAVAQSLDGRGVVRGDEVFEDFRATGGAPAAHAEDVLEG